MPQVLCARPCIGQAFLLPQVSGGFSKPPQQPIRASACSIHALKDVKGFKNQIAGASYTLYAALRSSGPSRTSTSVLDVVSCSFQRFNAALSAIARKHPQIEQDETNNRTYRIRSLLKKHQDRPRHDTTWTRRSESLIHFGTLDSRFDRVGVVCPTLSKAGARIWSDAYSSDA